MSESSRANPATLTRQVGMLLTGTTSVQVIGVLLSPVVARIYGPVALGEVAAATVIASTLTTIAMLSLDAAIVLADTYEEALEISGVILTMATFAAAVSSILFYLAMPWLVSFAWLSFLSRRTLFWSIFVSLSALFMTLIQVLSALATRERRFAAISTGRVAQSVSTNALTIILGLAAWGAMGAAIAVLLGQLAIVIALSSLSGASLTSLLRASPNYRRSREILAKHRRFPLYSYPQALLDSLRENALVGAVALTAGTVGLGHWAMLGRAVRGPLTVLGAAFTQVFTASAANAVREGERLTPLIRWISLRTGAIAVIATATLIAGGPILFKYVFGEIWSGAGEMARIFIPWMALNVVVAPFVQLAFILHRNRGFLLWGIFYNSGFAAICLLGPKLLHGSSLLAALSAFGAGTLFCVLFWLIRAARVFDDRFA